MALQCQLNHGLTSHNPCFLTNNNSLSTQQPAELAQIIAEMDRRATNLSYGLGIYFNETLFIQESSRPALGLSYLINTFWDLLNKLHHWLINAPTDNLEHLSDYTLINTKNIGISPGGIYVDKKNVRWLIKQGLPMGDDFAIREYIAASLYHYLSKGQTPINRLIIDTNNNQLLIASKLMNGFITLETAADYPTLPAYVDMLALALFLGDCDVNHENVGFISKKPVFIKLDYSFALSFCHAYPSLFNLMYQPMNLNNWDKEFDLLKLYLKYQRHYPHYNKLTPDTITQLELLLNSTVYINAIDISELRKIILTEFELSKHYLTAIHGPNLSLKKLRHYFEQVIKRLNSHYQVFHTFHEFLNLEKAILEKDLTQLINIMSKCLNFDFKFQAIDYITDKKLTGKELLAHHQISYRHLLTSYHQYLQNQSGLDEPFSTLSLANP